MEADKKKRGRGRPKAAPYNALNFRMEADLYELAQMKRGKKPLTRYFNDIIREALLMF